MPGSGQGPSITSKSAVPVSLKHDHLERRCPKLGNPVDFGYCRRCGEGSTACGKIVDCWWERFDVIEHLRCLLPDSDFRKLMAWKPKPKLTGILERIEKAKAAM